MTQNGGTFIIDLNYDNLLCDQARGYVAGPIWTLKNSHLTFGILSQYLSFSIYIFEFCTDNRRVSTVISTFSTLNGPRCLLQNIFCNLCQCLVKQELNYHDKDTQFYRFLESEFSQDPLRSTEKDLEKDSEGDLERDSERDSGRDSEDELQEGLSLLSQMGPDALLTMILRKQSVFSPVSSLHDSWCETMSWMLCERLKTVGLLTNPMNKMRVCWCTLYGIALITLPGISSW